MPISESLSFQFNNQSSTDYNIINCKIDSGLFQESFFSDREIKEVITRKSNYLVEVKSSPRILTITIAFTEDFDEDKLRSVKRWLSTESFSPLVFESMPDMIFYAIVIDSSELMHNGRSGYINLQFRCKDEFIYSPQYLSPLYDLSTNPISGTTIQFINNGDVDCQPILSLLKIDNGDISIINLSDGGKELKFSAVLNTDGTVKIASLTADEDLYIDSENEQIVTSIPLTYRYDNHNGIFLNMKRGVNNILITGTCKLQFKYQFRTL